MSHVVDLFTLRNTSTKPKDLIDEIFCSETEDALHFVNSFMDMKIETLSSIFSTLSNHIILFATNKSIKNCLSKKENITPEDLEKGADVYVHIPEHLLKQWKNLLTLMVSQFLTHFEKRPDRSSKPILFLLDEFSRLGKMENIVDGLATLRSKKITIAIILQSLAQLDYHYGKEARQIIADTCAYKAILNITDVESQEYFSKAVGTYDKIRVVKSQQYDRYTHFKAGSSITSMTEEKPIIKPHEFATLKEIVLLTPYGAFKADKNPYYNNFDKEHEKREIQGKEIVENLTEGEICETFKRNDFTYIFSMIKYAHFLSPEAFLCLMEQVDKNTKMKTFPDSMSKKETMEYLQIIKMKYFE